MVTTLKYTAFFDFIIVAVIVVAAVTDASKSSHKLRLNLNVIFFRSRNVHSDLFDGINKTKKKRRSNVLDSNH